MVIDLGSIDALVTSVKTLAKITKSMINLRDAAAIQDKMIELQGEILSAQSSALTAQADQFALLQRIGELEAKIAEMKAWDAEKQRYQLADGGLGCLAYTMKPDAPGTELPHSICANCYQKRKKSILQKDHEPGYELLRCHECHAVLRVKKIPVVTVVPLHGI